MSMKDGAPRSQTKSTHMNRLASIISCLSVVISILSLIVSITGYRASRQEWTRSGAELEYALTKPINHHGTAEVTDKNGKKIAGTDAYASQLHVLLTNSGRLTTVVISVQIISKTGQRYTSTCHDQEVRISPGESRLVGASFRAKSLPDVKELHATLASGEALRAKPIEADKESLDAAFSYALRHQKDSITPRCSIE